MKHLTLGIVIGVLLVSPAVAFTADASGVGIIKGTITTGGKPATEAVVSVEGVPADRVKAQLAGTKAQNKVMDQRSTKFVPAVLAILAGTTVDFPNNDTSWHNVYSKRGANDFDLGLYPPGKTRSTTFKKPGVARVLCNAHPDMEAFIVVKDHPFFSGADNAGSYRIDRVPLGKYRLQVWHPQLGTTETAVVVARDGEVVNIDFDLKKK